MTDSDFNGSGPIDVIITQNNSFEYRVPNPDGDENHAFYTFDRFEAIAAARDMYKGRKFLIYYRAVFEHPKTSICNTGIGT